MIVRINRVWQTSEDAASVAERNLRFIHQPSNYFYLVCIFPDNQYASTYEAWQDCGAGEWLGNDILGYVLHKSKPFLCQCALSTEIAGVTLSRLGRGYYSSSPSFVVCV